MPLQFTKMHGLGNDYIFIAIPDQQVKDPAALARYISHRQRGVGSDGLILVAPPTSANAHVRMIMYNADGSRAQMCGNGIRCLAKLAYERGLARANPLRVETDAGVLALDLTLSPSGQVTQVRVDMGEPILEARRIPVSIEAQRMIAHPFNLEDAVLPLTCVSIGNPHAVFFVPDTARVPLARWGPLVECHPLFPERINAHFATVVSLHHVRIVTWERGAGATQACGTGACAVCVAGVLTGLTARAITAELPGGQLELAWDEATNHVFMTGPAIEVFRGVWPA